MKKSVMGASAPTMDNLAAKLDDLSAQKRDLAERLLYLRAEMENLKKEADRDQKELKRIGNRDLLREMIPVVGMLESSIRAARDAENEGMATGLELILKQLISVLEKFGMRIIDAVGCRFDPHHHELAGTEDCASADPGTVLTVINRGWMFEDTVLQKAGVSAARRQGETSGR